MSEPNQTKRGVVTGGGFVVGLLLGWLLFDNLALGLLFGIALSAAGEGHHHVTKSRDPD